MMTHRIKLTASVATAVVTFFSITSLKSTYFANPQLEKTPEPNPKLPENFKYDGARRIIR